MYSSKYCTVQLLEASTVKKKEQRKETKTGSKSRKELNFNRNLRTNAFDAYLNKVTFLKKTNKKREQIKTFPHFI